MSSPDGLHIPARNAEFGANTINPFQDVEQASSGDTGAREDNRLEDHINPEDEGLGHVDGRHLHLYDRSKEESIPTRATEISGAVPIIGQEAYPLSRLIDSQLLGKSYTGSLESHRTSENDQVRSRGQLESVKLSIGNIARTSTAQEVDDGAAASLLKPEEAFSSQSILSFDPNVSDSLSLAKEADLDMKTTDAVGGSNDDESQSEIQSILEQFDGSIVEQDDREDVSMLVPQYPPRKSSLEPLGSASPSLEPKLPNQVSSSYFNGLAKLQTGPSSSSRKPSKASSVRSLNFAHSGRLKPVDSNRPVSPMSPSSLQKSLPPVPDVEPDLPFDFHRFLEQLRHRTADPVAKFLRSFLVEFGKKQWMVHEQVKIINDFLIFITSKMSQCEIWREVSDAEFDNAKEGMEKLVMNRLYSQTFSPAIPPAIPPAISIPPTKGKGKTVEKPYSPARRGQHQEDIERDEVLAQKVRIYGWVKEEHLDIRPIEDGGRRFLSLAQQELLKIKSYRAPRDKVICVLNCCKVIFGLLRNSKSADTSADSFVPLLIYVVLQANPEHLVSNVQYILRFRNQEKLGGEAGYYLSSLMGAIQFIENLDRTALTVSDEDFEMNVEAAVSAIAERDKEESLVSALAQISEKSGLSEPDLTHQSSVEAEMSASGQSSGRLGQADGGDEKAAVSSLLRTIQRPLSSIGRMFSEEVTSTQHTGNLRVQEVPAHPPDTPRRLSPAVFQPPRDSNDLRRSTDEPRARTSWMSAEDAAARQASAEAAEAHRIQRAEHDNVVETLASMFPGLDRDVIDDVVRLKEGRVGLAVEACLALSS
ncbi:hypothetical protein MMC17_009494 [Xylographa soralifera]|nr:hypothetical protein [Xylographa soralifera]